MERREGRIMDTVFSVLLVCLSCLVVFLCCGMLGGCLRAIKNVERKEKKDE